LIVDEHADVIVVGSGFGGSVAAYRFAKAGKNVLVLERGKEYPPGSFPRSPRELALNFWDPSEGLQGLFQTWSFRGIEAVVAAGLGGGSLIYANVLIRKDERWFVHEDRYKGGYENWPIGRSDLDSHYEEVERMLEAQVFPFASPGYDIPKTRALRDAALARGLDWELPNLAVTFANPNAAPARAAPIPVGAYPNLYGSPRETCRLCGECDIGCNFGAKNTLDHTYLSAAAAHGARIRSRSEVRRLAPRDGGGFEVGYVRHEPERGEGHPTDTSKLPVITVTGERLVIAAGALGSPYLLLRNRDEFGGLKPALGTRFSGNGDLLSFVMRARSVLDGSHGPVITSRVRVPDAVDGGDGRGHYVQDAGFPDLLNWVIETTQAPSTAARVLRFAARRIWARLTGDPRSELGAELSDVMGRAELSSKSLPLLGMGRDVPDGVMDLRGPGDKYLDIKWTTRTSRDYFHQVHRTMEALAGAMGGKLRHNPLWRLRRVVTVHPLGGCPMGRDRSEGVVDEWGESFDVPGLHVVDGSAMPGSVGPNPSLTIAAFADRMADHVLEGGTH
jgi:cholesterol oxidase